MITSTAAVVQQNNLPAEKETELDSTAISDTFVTETSIENNLSQENVTEQISEQVEEPAKEEEEPSANEEVKEPSANEEVEESSANEEVEEPAKPEEKEEEMLPQVFQSPPPPVQEEYLSPKKSFEDEAVAEYEEPPVEKSIIAEEEEKEPSEPANNDISLSQNETDQLDKGKQNGSAWEDESMDTSTIGAEPKNETLAKNDDEQSKSFGDQSTLPYESECEKMETDGVTNDVSEAKTNNEKPAPPVSTNGLCKVFRKTGCFLMIACTVSVSF